MMSRDELEALGLAALGDNVRVSRRAALHGAHRIRLGNNVRVDDFAVLSAGEGGIVVGDWVHIAVQCSLMGHARIELRDFAGLSARVAVYSSSDDYSGAWLTNPTVPEAFRGVRHAPVVLGRHAIVGAGSVVLPGATVGDGCAVGALSLVREDCAPFGVYAGVPARRVRERDRALLDLEARLRAEAG